MSPIPSRRLPLLLLAAVGILGCSVERPPDLRWSGRVAYLYGPIHGKLQTPTGGQPGTTTPGRPTLHELQIDRAGIPDVAIKARWDDNEIYGGYRRVRLNHSATLKEPLVSQGHTFAAGTKVDATVGMDWYRAGYRRWFNWFGPAGQAGSLALAPGAGIALWNFDYHLDAPGPDDASRQYIRPTPQLSLEADYPLTPRLSLTGEVLASVPLGRQPRIYSGEIDARYRLLRRARFTLDAELGLGFDRIEYTNSGDNPVPNDIQVDMGPMVLGGLMIQF